MSAKASIKAGTQIIKVAASEETPNKLAIKSLNSCNIFYKFKSMIPCITIKSAFKTTETFAAVAQP
tara:strand:+ start:341 stop:538 length:198 start_codon:yes stop_codon:yes gene_type:complete